MSNRDRAERQSDATLCRRIAEAQEWINLEWDEFAQWWYGVNPEINRAYKTSVPRYDTDPAACLGLLDYLSRQEWCIYVQFFAVHNYKKEIIGKEAVILGPMSCEWRGRGADDMEAFCRAAAAALEAGKEANHVQS